MSRYLRVVAAVAALMLVGTACGNNSASNSAGGGGTSSGGTPVKGGTLHAVMTQDFFHGLDPTQEYYSVSWEALRCCLARTLLSYNGKPSEQGGAAPQPDIATAMPQVSSDGLTYTMTIKDGVKFGDPLNRQVTAQDFVNSFNRLADPSVNTPGYSFYYTDITGFQDVLDGKTKVVSGVTAIDPKTLQIKLDQANPDMNYLLAMSATAPMPEEALKYHYKGTEYGQFMVSSGPYEYEGMAGFDLSSKNPPSGMDIGRNYVFVRNPSYDPSTDTLRKAYPDRIEIQVGGETQTLLDKVAAGGADWCIDCLATSATLQKYGNDPTLTDKVKIYPSDALSYIGLNIFQAPFDDVHVRKAVNWAVDKNALWTLAGGDPAGVIAGHFIPPSMMGGQLATYDPYATPGNKGSVTDAKKEMALSKYDTNHDGVCDGSVCTVTDLIVSNDNDQLKGAQILQQSFAPIGIKLDIKQLAYNALVTKCATLAAHTAFCGAAWGKDYPSPYTYFSPLLDGGENGSNYSFMGTTAAALTKAGYNVPADGIPSIHDKIDACRATAIGTAQDTCWANLDKYVMETVVPIIPRRFPTNIDVLGANIDNYSYDQFAGVGAIDQMSLVNGGQ
ncbi:MAG: peptide/nickel transport system substrate-binding protein [Actinomycetota bacterium]|nr:peptide/nickel transport system substrate-binding protein [Actinomycetota bacterium]